MERGGYETVTANKQWRDICRALPQLDLSGQTSASYNMRLNYERCLLDFENYLASGQYEADVAAGRAPVHTHSTDGAVTRFTIPGAYPAVDAPDANGGGAGGGGAAGVGSTDPTAAGTSLTATGIVAPAAVNNKTTTETTAAANANTEIQSLGCQLRESGTAAVGRVVQRYWPEEGGWWDATVTDFNAETKEHQLTYNIGRPDESFEFVNLAELEDHEFRLKNKDGGADGGNGNRLEEEAEKDAEVAVQQLDREETIAPNAPEDGAGEAAAVAEMEVDV
jgi:hypothetical protein